MLECKEFIYAGTCTIIDTFLINDEERKLCDEQTLIPVIDKSSLRLTKMLAHTMNIIFLISLQGEDSLHFFVFELFYQGKQNVILVTQLT